MADHGARILVVAQAWIGDVVLSQILFALLKRQQADAAIDVVAPLWAEALLKRMPQVSRHIALDVRHGRLGVWRRCALARRLRGHYRQAVVIPRSAKAAVVPWLAGIRQRTGFAGKTRKGLINDPRPRPPDALTRMARLASPEAIAPDSIPWPRLEGSRKQAAELFREWGMPPTASIIGLAPGAAYGRAKRWGTEPFARLAAQLARQGHHICVTGSAKDRPSGEIIAQAAPGQATNLCGKTTLDQAIDLVQGFKAVVCNDSGLMHIAAAVDTPVVGVYGPTSPDTHPPLARVRAICSARTLCSPCHRRTCPYGHHACMTRIRPEHVGQAVLDLLRQ